MLLAASAFAPAGARAANFTASLDRDSITLGESATLSLEFEGGQSKAKLTSPAVAGLQFGNPSRSFSQNIDFNSGQVNTRLVLAYTVTPQREGEFTIPALTADVNGQQLSTLPLKLTVLKADAPPAATIASGNEIAFMKLSLPQKKVYVGQMLTAQLQVCLRDDVQNFGNFQFTGQPANGFTINKMAQGQQQRAQIGNHVYTVIPLTFALTAVKSGTLSLGPFIASATLVVSSSNDQGGDPFMRQFFNQGEQKQVSLATETLTAESLPLLAENVPANFNGTYSWQLRIGRDRKSLVRRITAVGNPITVRMQISGRGALGAIQLPDQSALSNFRYYPRLKPESPISFGLEGTRRRLKIRNRHAAKF